MAVSRLIRKPDRPGRINLVAPLGLVAK